MKKQLQKKGFFYTVTKDQIKEHRKRSVKDIFTWIESTNKFVTAIRQPSEKRNAQHFTAK